MIRHTSRRVLSDPLFGTIPIAGIKSAANRAKGAVDTANTTAAGYGTGATNVGAALVPYEEKQLTNPTGIAPADKSAMLTSAAEGAGGAAGSLKGEAVLSAARRRNLASVSGDLGEIARAGTRAATAGNLEVENENTRTKLAQQAEAAKMLESHYGTDVAAQLKAEGLVPEDIDAWSKANQTGWQQNAMGWINAVKGGSKGPASYI
jgi:hypothetical protein